jgi:hypothetical protein
LSRELIATGFGFGKDERHDSGTAPSEKQQPASRVLQLQRTQQHEQQPAPVVRPQVSREQISHAPATTSGFGVSWAAALAEEELGLVAPITSSPSKAIASTASIGGYQSAGLAQTASSSSLPSSSKLSPPQPRSPPLAKSKSPSASMRVRKPHATPPRQLSPVPRELALPLRPEEVKEQQKILEETQREMREIKALESQIGWEMHREEKAQVVNEKKEAEKDIMEWRNQLASGLKEFAESKAFEQKIEDLGASKEFQEFKRDRKQVDKEENLQLIKEQYEADTEFSQMQAEIAKTAALDRHAMNLEHLEEIQVLREVKIQEKVQEKTTEEQERALEQRLNFKHQATQLRSQKEEMLRNLQMLRSVQKQPVCTSGRAGRPRAAKGGH